MVTVNFGRLFFGGESGGTGLPGAGVNLVRDQHWRAGFGLAVAGAFRKQREESDDPSLRGMGDIERVLRKPVYWEIPHDNEVTLATQVGKPVILAKPRSRASH